MPYSSRRLPQTQQNSDRLSTIRPVSSPSPVSAVSHASSGYRYDNPAPPYDNPQQRLLQREPQYAQPVPTHLSYGPSGPAYQPPAPVFSPPPQSSIYHTFSPPPSQHGGSTLPFFEAALARSRGENVPNPMVSPPPLVNMQPLPLYLPPSDMNHPDVNVGFHQSNTVRFTHTATPVGRQPAASQSPSPGYDKSYDGGYGDEGYRYGGNEEGEMEKGLLTYPTQDRGFDGDEKKEYYSNPYETGPFWDEKSAMGGLNDELGDIGHLPAIHVQSPTTGSNALSFADMNAQIMGSAATQHFGPAPTGRVGRREHNAAGHRRIKQKATLDANGFFAVDMPIPTRLAQFLPVKGVEEQKSTRYTAVTTDPDDFAASGLRLRQNLCNPPRQTELFIVITMYNEDAQLFCRTLYGVMKNISHLCGRKNSRVWGKDGWQKVVVCIVADGRKNVNPRVLDCLSALGVFQEGAMTSKVKDRPVTAHVFEYTTSFALDPDMHFKYPDKGIVPCQIIFCMKEKNAKKINSHRWFFNAFAPLLAPNICILLDVGTRPETKSLYHLWKAFDRNSKVGGACGEIATFKGKTWRSLLNPLVAAQCFEYKMSNILDKPMESLFGYCTVLPGAFSAYRWIALQNNADGTGPLASYFQGEQLNTGKADTFTANMVRYLAEDRILCFEIIAKAKANWVLKFVKSAVGETDCPDSIPEFIAQRRRWLNGSFFAAVYSLIHVRQVWRSDHSFPRKVSLMLEFVYNALNLLFTWFSLANFYVFFVILTSALEAPQFGIPKIWVLNRICQYGYLGVLVACFIFAMGNRPQGSPWKYKSAIYLFAVLTMYMLVGAVLCTVQAVKNIGSPVFTNMVVSLVTTYGVFIVSSILAMDPWHILTCFAQYILFSPTYINVLNIYAYSNLHDLSWGTKGSDAAEPTELGAVSGVGNQVEVALVSAQQDIDIAYQDALDNIRLKRAKVDADELPPKGEVSEQKQKDVYANFRTNLLLLWSLSNALLASLVLSGGDASATFTGGGSNVTAVYMLVILVFVSGMAIFRFICSTLYLIFRLFGA